MSTLHLTLRRAPFLAIAAGQKTKEYRLRSPYWERRFADGCKWTVIEFRNGYRPDSPRMRVELAGIESGIDPQSGEPCFVLHLGRVLARADRFAACE